MAKKADLEADFVAYEEAMRAARNAQQSGDYLSAVELALSATQHVDGMMQYERRYAGQTDRDSVGAIDIVLKYAPLMFDFASLTHVADLLKSQRRIDKNTTADIATSVAKSIELMWDAHRLWNALEKDSDTRQDKLRANLGGEQDGWQWIAETWERMGYINRVPEGGSYRLVLTSRLDEKVRGKCPSCGVAGSATKMRLLEEINCPKCHANVYFVFLAGVGS
jgi:hypothetical protein